MVRCRISCLHVSSGLGSLCGTVMFFVLTFYTRNYYAGFFALTSAIFSAITLHLELLTHNDRLVTWYSPNILDSLAAFAAIVSIITIGIALFFQVFAYTHNIPSEPFGGSHYATATWTWTTSAWAGTVYFRSSKHAKYYNILKVFL